MDNKEFNELILKDYAYRKTMHIINFSYYGKLNTLTYVERDASIIETFYNKFLLLDFLKQHSFKKNQFIRKDVFFTNVVVDNLRKY